jgi:hypothetical protein
MPGQMLTAASSLLCPHGGTVQIVPAAQVTMAAGSPVATTDATFTVVGCPFMLPTVPPIPSPCVTIQWQLTDSKVKAVGAATLSTTSQGLCMSAAQCPQGPVSISSTQPKVSSS